MVTITTEQARTRFTTLPPTLQDAVFSEQTAEIIAATIEKFNLSEERAEDIPALVGWVLLGFLHIEDLPNEIETAARVPKPLAKEIADSLSNKIFEPLRPALAQFHAPVPNPMEAAFAAPKIVGTTAAPKILSGTTYEATPGPQKNVIVGPRIAQEQGTSNKEQGALTSNLPSGIGKPIPHFEPKPNLGGPMAASVAPMKKQESTGEFARLAAEQGSGTSQPIVKALTPVTPTSRPPIQISGSVGPGLRRDDKSAAITPNPLPPTPRPSPVMLQSTSLPKPIQNAPSLNNPQRAVDILSGKKFPVPLPMKSAVIEFGTRDQGPGTRMPAPISPTTPTARLNEPQPGRQITEITAPAQLTPPTASPKPTMPSTPSMAPKPVSLPIEPVKPQRQPQPQSQPATPIKPIGLAPIKIAPTPPAPIPPKTGEKVIVKNLSEKD